MVGNPGAWPACLPYQLPWAAPAPTAVSPAKCPGAEGFLSSCVAAELRLFQLRVWRCVTFFFFVRKIYRTNKR